MASPSKTVKVESAAQFNDLLKKSKIVVTDFYADWCGPCKQMAPIFEQLSSSLSRPNQVTFTKVDTDAQKDIASQYQVTALPTFIIFRDGKVSQKIKGTNVAELSKAVKELATAAGSVDGASGSGSGGVWRGAELPRGYGDVTDQIEIRSSELLNVDPEFGVVRTLIDTSKPGALGGGKKTEKDWVVTDTDNQLLLFTPFQSMIKLHTLQITSIKDEDEDVVQPGVIKLFTNRTHNMAFEDAEGEAATQTIELSEDSFNAQGTANIPLRFVKFQNINSLVLFVESGLGSGEKTRVDRIRLIGETGEKREMGKLEKVGDEA